jgi:S-adenosylmethionine:tRNA ribosyltransferase-isomerase
MLVSDFHYELPPERIAQEPLADRAGSRLLHLDRRQGRWDDVTFQEFPGILRPGDLLVLNNTKVFPARLYARRLRGGRTPSNSEAYWSGRIEVLLTRQSGDDPNGWECLVRPGKKVAVGERLAFGDPAELEAEVMERGSFGERRIRFRPVADFFERLERLGRVPLPPYIRRKTETRRGAETGTQAKNGDSDSDRERYQTVYARERGSVAAPTAGLHFTPEILERIRGRGIEVTEVTLHVGLGTFQPVRTERVEDHRLHRELYEISEASALAINRAKGEGRRVVAVGTTTVRTLEYAAGQGAQGGVRAGPGEADIFLYPGYRFQVVDALLTNFHLPKSSLLMLVCALGGTDLVMRAYRHAVQSEYRFYSYGDCMLVE